MSQCPLLTCVVGGCRSPLVSPTPLATACFCVVHEAEFWASSEGRRVQALGLLPAGGEVESRAHTALADFTRRRLAEGVTK